MPKKAESDSSTAAENIQDAEGTEKPEVAAGKPTGFTPRFKASNMSKKVKEDAEEVPSIEEESTNATSAPADPSVSTPKGFTPRFKAGITKSVTNQENLPESPSEKDNKLPENPSANPMSKPVGFKPRFGGKKSSDQNPKED